MSTGSNTLQVKVAQAADPQLPRWERWGLTVAFAIYFIWQLNAVMHHGSWGQDFHAHVNWIGTAMQDPGTFLTQYTEGRTNPPLFHFLGALVCQLTRGIHTLEVIALLTVIANMVALWLVSRVLVRFIQTPAMRLACMVFLLFVPFAMIHAAVLAADALATPVFLTLVYLFTLLTTPRSRSGFAWIVSGITLLLLVGLATKFTFASLVVASVVGYLLLYNTGHLNGRRAVVGVLAILLCPAVFAWVEIQQYTSQQKYNLGIPRNVWVNPLSSPHMDLCTLLMVNHIDQKVLTAPPYDLKEDGTFALLVSNRHSYPALLHLAMFTDLINIYQYDPTDSYFGARGPMAHKRMKLAVKTSLFFSLSAVVGLPLMLTWIAVAVARRRGKDWAIGAILALFSCAFFLNIVGFFPFVPGVYSGGYWLPRLVAPALLCFFALSFAFWDRLVVRRFSALGWACLLLVVLQSGLHLSFLWPWGGDLRPSPVVETMFRSPFLAPIAASPP
jgi:4-amino-4-deoxy-L-arabinose transferase-like glycosyltransferase